jgi:hypothetical protein
VKKKPSTSSSSPSSAPAPSISRSADRRAPTREEIAARALELWQQAGCPHGRDQEHWYEAERQLANIRRNLDNPAPHPAAGERAPQTEDTVVDDIDAAFNDPPLSGREIESLPDKGRPGNRRSPTSL